MGTSNDAHLSPPQGTRENVADLVSRPANNAARNSCLPLLPSRGGERRGNERVSTWNNAHPSPRPSPPQGAREKGVVELVAHHADIAGVRETGVAELVAHHADIAGARETGVAELVAHHADSAARKASARLMARSGVSACTTK